MSASVSIPARRARRWLYALAVFLPALMLLARLAMGFTSGDRPALILFVVPIVLCAYLGGLGPGLVCTTVAAVLSNVILMAPDYRFTFASALDSVQWLMLIASGTLISVLTESLQSVRRKEGRAANPGGGLTTERKTQAGFALALALLLAIGAVSYYSVVRLRHDTAQLERAHEVLTRLSSLLSTVNDAETAQRGYTITDEESFLQPYYDSVLSVGSELRALRELTAGDAAQRRRVEALGPLVEERMRAALGIIELSRSRRFTEARAAVATGTGKEMHDRIRGIVAELQDTERAVLAEWETRGGNTSTAAKMVIVTGTALAFALVAVALLVIRRDFAAREAAEDTVRRQVALLDMASDAVLVNDLENRIQYWNQGAQRLFGWEAKDAEGRIAFELLATEFPIPRDDINRRLQECGDWRGELVQTTRDGRRITVESHWSLRRDRLGRAEAVLEINQDVTERKTAESDLRDAHDVLDARVRAATAELEDVNASLRQSQQRLLLFVEHAPAKLAMFDREMRYLTASRRWRSEYGLDEGDLLGVSHSEIFPEISEAWKAVHRRAMAGEIVREEKDRFERPDGSVQWLRWEVRPWHEAAGAVGGIVIFSEDITASVAAVSALHARDLALAANRMKSEFLATMSHELRTPLNGIIGFSELLFDEKPGPLNAWQKDYLNDVLNSGHHLLQLINDVLDLSKVEAGWMEFFPETFSLRKAVQEGCSVVSPLAKKKCIAIRTEIEPAVESITLDQQKLKQVLLNLLSNAVKFTDHGGHVAVVAGLHDSGGLKLQVRDSGIGIKPEDFEKLFVEFQQIDSGTSRRYEGTGLGLALTKKIVEYQKGTIAVESRPGKGSTFTVILPLGAEKNADSLNRREAA